MDRSQTAQNPRHKPVQLFSSHGPCNNFQSADEELYFPVAVACQAF